MRTVSQTASWSQSTRILLDVLDLPARRAFMPETLPRPAPEPGLAGRKGPVERLGIHPGQHQHGPQHGVGDDGRQKPGAVEPWREREPFLALVVFGPSGRVAAGRKLKAHCWPSGR